MEEVRRWITVREASIRKTLQELYQLLLAADDEHWRHVLAGFIAYPTFNQGRLHTIEYAIHALDRVHAHGNPVTDGMTSRHLHALTEKLRHQIRELQHQYY